MKKHQIVGTLPGTMGQCVNCKLTVEMDTSLARDRTSYDTKTTTLRISDERGGSLDGLSWADCKPAVRVQRWTTKARKPSC